MGARPAPSIKDAARALGCVERRRLQNDRVSKPSRTAHAKRRRSLLFATLNLAEVTSNGEAERRAASAPPNEDALSTNIDTLTRPQALPAAARSSDC